MDAAILDAIQHALASPPLDALMAGITFLGDFAIPWLIAACALLLSPRWRTYGIAVLIALALAVIAGHLLLKPLVMRTRPFIEYGFPIIIAPPRGSSFPSSHTLVSFAAATALCCVPKRGRAVAAAKAGAVVLACLIAFSRLYLYVHYPTDVAAGILIGIGCGFAAVALARKLRPDRAGAP